jgi:ABC-type lipoprotein release transport system permease subunit
MITKLAFRNLFRNRWRSLLTIGGVAAAVVVLVWVSAFTEGMMTQMIRGATTLETGQVQIQTEAYAEEPKIWYSFSAGEELYERVARVEGVQGVEPRVEISGLAGTDERSKVTRFVGLDARRSTGLKEAVVEGEWLSKTPPPAADKREAVIGVDLAREIGVEVGDEIVALASGQDGSLGNDLFTVVGLVKAGNTSIDQRTTFLHLADAQFLGAMDGEIHELMIRSTPIREAERTAEAIEPVARSWQAEQMAGATTFVDGNERAKSLVVRPWQELVPTLADYVKLSGSSMGFIYVVLYFLAALGILNTQRMSALERRREFGVLQAVGMTPGRLFATVLWETTLLTLIGAVVGAVLGTGLNLYLAEYGFNMGLFVEQDSFTFMGVAVSMRIYPTITWAGTLTPIAAILPVAFLCGLWPALSSARLNPAQAISKRD